MFGHSGSLNGILIDEEVLSELRDAHIYSKKDLALSSKGFLRLNPVFFIKLYNPKISFKDV